MISVYKDFDNIPKALKKKKNGWQDSEVKQILFQLYHGKCAYSEEKLSLSTATVEHYRSKKTHSWLENEWSNLLLVSQTCNASAAAKFPIKGIISTESQLEENKRADSNYLLNEKPLLVHPEIDTAENHVYFTTDGLIYGFTDKGKTTIDVFGLNSTSLIEKRRSKINHFVSLFYAFFQKDNLNEYFRLLETSGYPEAEFSRLGQQMFLQFEEFLLPIIQHNTQVLEKLSEEIVKKEFQILTAYQKFLAETNGIKDFKPYFSNGKNLPIAINKLKIKNFQGIKETEISDIPLSTQWIFLTGENGFGKTSILKALLLGLMDAEKNPIRQTIDSNSQVALNLTANNLFYQSTFGIYEHKGFKSFVAAYGSNRSNLSKTNTSISVFENLFEISDNAQILNIEQLLLRIWYNEELAVLKKQLLDVFYILIPKLAKIEVVIADNKTDTKVIYFEKDDDGDELKPVEFNQLALGIKSILGLVGDMVQRLFEGRSFVNSEKGREVFDIDEPEFEVDSETAKILVAQQKEQKTITSLQDLFGIVIIDEIDAHLHPIWQRDLVKKLSDVFPKVQFIVSTHSAMPLLGAPSDSVIINVQRSKEEGVYMRRLKKLEKEIKYLLPNQILTSDIFNVENIENINLKSNESNKISLQDTYQELKDNQKLKKQLKKLADNKASLPADLFD